MSPSKINPNNKKAVTAPIDKIHPPNESSEEEAPLQEEIREPSIFEFAEFDPDREKKLREYATKIIKDMDRFTDESFLPNQSSLCDEAQLKDVGFQNIKWKRLSEIYPKH